MNVTFDDVRLRSNLTTDETTKFTEKIPSYTIRGFRQSRSFTLGDIEGFVQKIPRT